MRIAMNPRFTLAVAGVLAVTAPRSDAQQPAREVAPLARLEQSLDAETYRSVVQVIDAAKARALPVDPLVDRALEGAMKRATGKRIRDAVSSLAQRLEIARDMLAPSPTPADIAAGAGALGVGVPRETLRAIRSVQPDQPIAVPLGVLTELVARSVPVDRAATLVVQLLRRGATSTQLVGLSADVQRDIAAGIEPGAALDLRTRGVASTLPGGATAVLGDNAAAPNAPVTAGELNAGNRSSPRAGSPTPAPGSRRP
jgi:hypothetical protein